MHFQKFFRIFLLSVFPALFLGLLRPEGFALPEGFVDHGVAAPVGRQPFGNNVYATVDGDGRPMVFMKLWAGPHASYLFIDAETGETEQIAPGSGGRGGWPVLFSPENKIYDTLGPDFIEIDLNTRELRRVGKISGSMALGHTIAPDGVVYSGIYPTGVLVSYNPATGEYRNHGKISEESWPQYVRPLAAGNDGWIYGGLGQKSAQILAYNTKTGKSRGLIPERDRKAGSGQVYLGSDGLIYGNAPGWGWHAIENGVAKPVEKPASRAAQPSGRDFPNGARLTGIDVANRRLQIRDAGSESSRTLSFSYDSPGVQIYGLVSGPDGKIYGATGIPLRIWRFDPGTGEMNNWGLGDHAGHVNQFTLQNDKLYGAIYSSGSLIEYDPAKPYDDRAVRSSTNPKHLHGFVYGHGGSPDMFGRPYVIFSHPDKKHVILGGNPSRVRAGGGLLIYNIETGEETALKPEDLIENQGVMTIGALANGDLIVGSTTAAATAGQSAATAAEIYQIDWKSKEVVKRWRPEPTVGSIRDLLVGENDLVYIQTSGGRFLVLDPKSGEFVHDEQITEYGPVTGGQAPRVMKFGPDGRIYILFRTAIAAFDPKTMTHSEVARPGVTISAGIAIQDGRLYFSSGSRLLSWKLD
ncbi:MAG TPA: hypothetical protein VK041_04580 [Opitutales bacterium]|nr:hypothetical protein [Opitutales bacterium]